MIHPSYSDLMKVVNSEVEPGETDHRRRRGFRGKPGQKAPFSCY